MIAAASFAAALLGAARRPAALAAAPARVTLTGPQSGTIRVTNAGGGAIVVDAAPAGFALDLRGRPRILAHPDRASSRLSVLPRRVALRAGAVATLTVSAPVPPGVRPGDHPALVLLATEPRPEAGLGVRMQIGVVVIVRVPGAVTRRLVLRAVRVRHLRRADLLVVSVRNGGDVTERLTRRRIRMTLLRHGRVVARLRTAPRELFPGAAASERFRYRGRLRGPVTALVEVEHARGGVSTIRRTFRLRL